MNLFEIVNISQNDEKSVISFNAIAIGNVFEIFLIF